MDLIWTAEVPMIMHTMVSDLQQKVVGEGAEAQKVYNEFAEMCEDRSQGLNVSMGIIFLSCLRSFDWSNNP